MTVTFAAACQDLVLFERMKWLAFGIYAWADKPERHQVKEAGSGVFIAPRLALTARHVGQCFGRLEPDYEARQRRKTLFDPQYARIEKKSEYAARAYQVVGDRYLPPPEDQIVWYPKVNWPSHDTDVNLLVLEPSTPAAEEAEKEQRYFDWYLKPPPLGKRVRIYGFPNAKLMVEGVDHESDVGFEVAVARVVENFYPLREHGMASFPVFRVDKVLAEGFSGSPVLWNDKLVGIFSGPDLVVPLWPLALLAYPPAFQEPDIAFADHLESGLVNAWDWSEVKGGVKRVPCAEALAGFEDPYRCEKMHVVLK